MEKNAKAGGFVVVCGFLAKSTVMKTSYILAGESALSVG